MSAVALAGPPVAAKLLDRVAARVESRAAAGKSRPHLAAVLVGDDPASATYVRLKRRDAEKVGIGSSDHRLPAGASTEEVVATVRGLSGDDAVSGILVQLPLPPQVDAEAVVEAVDPVKDVDGLHPFNAGRLALGSPLVSPCTPAGILELLDHYQVPIEGRRAVVVGRSNIVGKPVALLLLARNATVTICHSRTRDLAAVTRQADLLVSAVGKTFYIEPGMVKPGAAVVDVGVNRVDGRLVGDVHPDVAGVAGWLTPSPGGVGPLTRAMLVHNTLAAEERRRP
jgi:methylenetetrahydrofolate dehydrogenase (NADP+) / methenyltetrahydrofolate cyclohydrolase